MYNILEDIIPTNKVLWKDMDKKELRSMRIISFESTLFRVLQN